MKGYIKASYPFLLLFLFLVMIFISPFFHEGGHYFAARFFGIDPKDIEVTFLSIRPHIVIPDGSLTLDELRVFHHAGGFMSGLIFLILYALTLLLYCRKKGYEPSHFSSWFSLIFLIIAGLELYNGTIEGANFNFYITQSNSLQYLLIIILAASLHYFATPFRSRTIAIYKKTIKMH